MTILSIVGGKGPGPIEGEEPERLSRSLHQNALTAEELGFFNEVKNFLGSSVNEQMLVQAIKSHGSHTQSHLSGNNVLNDVISLYFDRMESVEKPNKQVRFDEHLDVPSPAPSVSRPYAFNTRGTTMEEPKVIDLTSDEDKGVQKWGNVPRSVLGNREEQDVIKAIEESLKDNQNIPGFSPFAQRDPENPYERRRCGLAPVGLKNIGNSCWFNVIVQTLFHIPRFRQILFDTPVNNRTKYITGKSNSWGNESGQPNETNTDALTTSLLISLRQLAACLEASSRAYVDPTNVLKIISELNMSLNKAAPCIGIQQDATEMLLRLIEWLEVAFRVESISEVQLQSPHPSSSSISCGEIMDTNDENMVPNASSAEQTLTPGGEAHFDKLGSDDLNSNLTPEHPFDALFHGSHVEIRPNAEITIGVSSPLKLANSLQMINLDVSYDNLYDSLEAYHLSDAPAKELWFESLPSVVIFSLVRFSYKNGQTEKVHSQFQFPRVIYMDRYLYRNRTFVSEKRIERKSLKKRLAHVMCELEGWEKFPAGDTKIPLPSLIDAVVKYASSATNAQQPMEVCDETPSFSIVSDSSSPHVERGDVMLVCPSLDRTIIPADVDMNTVTSVLQTLSANAQERIDELQKEANTLQENIESIFDVDGMREEPYHLHSVIVHEGEANVGHYWAYIASSPLCNVQDKEVSWRKFNDKSVEPATWQQIEEDSFGSRRACSAYCLVYTRKKCEGVLYGQEQKRPAQSIVQLIDSLPNDLKLEVSTDNALFDAEIIKWDTDHPTIVYEPENRTIITPCKDGDLLDMVSYKGPVDFDALFKRHYEHAARFFGLFMLESALNALNVMDELFLERDESAFNLIQELLTNHVGHYEKALKMSDKLYIDRLMFLIDWASIFGIPLNNSAKSIFVLRMLMNIDVTQYSNVVSACEKVVEKFVGDDPSSEVILHNTHILYELFCQMVAVMSDIVKKVDLSSIKQSGTTLSTDIQQSRLLCVSIRMMERIDMYATVKSSNLDQKMFFCLIHNALLIIYVIRISQRLIDHIGSELDDSILADNENFLNEEYKAMIIRLHRMDNDASERTIQYVISIWNQLLSNSNGLQRLPRVYQKILDASEQKTLSNMPAPKLNVKAGNSGYDLFRLRQAMCTNLEVKCIDDLNILVRTVVQGKSIIGNAISN
ncbi:Ubiquitin carboxyl-terminal hydrolase family protein [Brugia malayi]|uniref:Bm4754 n=1 Tax=Brugia malayi TaxID=6279 RepID=A0A0K0JG09_BRUMA|nr:Ubiquitin carboxyl-terminal hydrolase family protein [Brugia malayi]CRZ21753.1 Bm4754 [Brugia malayi]VIO93518.1 Ubiquitin carboxyl-terminal hydrolase family protein [Brugia malayi]